METVKLYTTYCPKCKVLETKLKQKNIEFEICDSESDIQELIDKGFKSAPVLSVDDEFMNFTDAVNWVNNKNWVNNNI